MQLFKSAISFSSIIENSSKNNIERKTHSSLAKNLFISLLYKKKLNIIFSSFSIIFK